MGIFSVGGLFFHGELCRECLGVKFLQIFEKREFLWEGIFYRGMFRGSLG